MDDKQARTIRTLLIVISFFVLAIIVLLLLLYVRPAPSGPRGSQGRQGDRGEPAVIDYTRIDQLITEKIAEKIARLPIPQNGQNGINGHDGYTPIKGKDYTDGKDGMNGVDGRQRSVRFNPDTKSFETQLEGDDFWEVILDVCAEFPAMCEVP